MNGITHMLTKQGGLYSYGKTDSGPSILGLGDSVQEQTNPQIHEYFKNTKVKEIKTSKSHCVVLTSNGDLYSWGSNTEGQLGIAEFNGKHASQPLRIKHSNLDITNIDAGPTYSLFFSSKK